MVTAMPKIDYDNMPYTKLESTGETVKRNAFYLPDEDAEESPDIYRGYHTIDTSNLTFNNPILLSKKETE